MTGIIKVDTIQNNGGTTGLTIDSTGRVLQPNGVFAYVNLTTSNAQDGSHPYTSTGVDMRFDKINVNRGSAYTESNGRFTAPVAGVYRLFISLLKVNTGNPMYWTVFKNGSSTLFSGYNSNSGYGPSMGEAFFELAANDYLTVRLQDGGINLTANTATQYNNVTFQLVG